MENSTSGAKPKGLLGCLPDAFSKENEKVLFFVDGRTLIHKAGEKPVIPFKSEAYKELERGAERKTSNESS